MVARLALATGMTDAELKVLAWGVGLLFAYGPLHLTGLEIIRRIRPGASRHAVLGLLTTFWGLAVLHLLEIAIAAALLAHLLNDPINGVITPGSGSAAADHLYIAGVSFATLGFAHLEADGPIRLLVMLLSLSGFMLITWSAAFIFTIWGENFRR